MLSTLFQRSVARGLLGSSIDGIAASSPLPALVQQTRGRKRGLKKTLSRQERLLRREKREEKEAARKQYTFMERIKIRQMKSLLSPSQQGPGRYDAEAEIKLPDAPACDVYIGKNVKTQYYSIAAALAVHRSLQKPEVYNNPAAPVKLRIELNMTTERATKPLTASEEIVPVPHVFKHNEKRSILALAADEENQAKALEAGAELSLGADMIKKILKGQFRVDDYDFCVAHTNMSTLIAPLRGVLRSRFPTQLNGAMDDDMAELVHRFRSGAKISIKSDPVYPIWGLCEPVVGKLDMQDEQIEANISAIISAICAHRNPALGPFINRALLAVIPTQNYIAIDVTRFMPVATEEQTEKLQKRKQKKKSSKAAAEEETAVAEDHYLLGLM